jgi:hypothetical protein
MAASNEATPPASWDIFENFGPVDDGFSFDTCTEDSAVVTPIDKVNFTGLYGSVGSRTGHHQMYLFDIEKKYVLVNFLIVHTQDGKKPVLICSKCDSSAELSDFYDIDWTEGVFLNTSGTCYHCKVVKSIMAAYFNVHTVEELVGNISDASWIPSGVHPVRPPLNGKHGSIVIDLDEASKETIMAVKMVSFN